MWIEPPCVRPIPPHLIAALLFAVGLLIVSALAVMGVFEPLVDVVKRLARNFRMRHLLIAPGLLALCVYGSTKPTPPPVVVEKGIKLTKCVQTSRRIDFEWKSEDDRILPGATYYVQEWLDGRWVTVAATTETKYSLVGFTIDVTRRYRIVTDVTEGVGDE